MARRGLVSTVLAAALVLASASSAVADSNAKKAQRYTVITPYSDIKAGAARIEVKAPADTVARVITDYNNYTKLTKKFDKARVVGKKGNTTDVYLQVPILKGAAKIWAVVRFEPAQKTGNEQSVKAHLVDGNVRRLDATWRIKSIDEKTTELSLEMLIVPKLPVPGALVTPEVAYAADQAVTGSRKRAENPSN